MFGLLLFLIFNSLSRVALFGLAFIEKQVELSIIDIAQVFSLGIVNDLITACYFAIPITLIKLFFSDSAKKNNIVRRIIFSYHFIIVQALCFLVVSEFTFWIEFSTKFNFIAVDYLIYTHEVIGNIQESYPIWLIFPLLITVAVAIYYKIYPSISARINIKQSLRLKLCHFLIATCLSLLSFFFYEPKITDIQDNNYLSELSKNGIYNLFSAFNHNAIDYPELYKTRDPETSLKDLSKYIDGSTTLTRDIKASGPKKDYNIFLITVESLSAEFIGIDYDKIPLTPVLTDLIKKSLYFDNFYATGTRTVRGLEAITLSTPPLPGQSILRRQDNENLFSIASVLNKADYDIKFIYGGYGYFDNMNYFFSNNGFKIWDRNSIPKDEVSFSNVWGISDEDLYLQAINQADASYKNNKKFFSLIMTTSNHRPYTYPDGKINIPSKSNRQGGVKYTDYAIGEFLKIARTKPWFDNTIFVITADHCAGSAGRKALPPEKYHIPLFIYAPKLIQPGIVKKMSSQIDIAPTILSLLNISYKSQFFGSDILSKDYQNAFISTFQKLGYIEKNKLIVLAPGKISKTYNILKNNDIIETKEDTELTNRAIDYYQSAYYLYYNRVLKQDDDKKN
jgi:phosphoglycerol transferase MdoB-like AlkP superfamily enzyme